LVIYYKGVNIWDVSNINFSLLQSEFHKKRFRWNGFWYWVSSIISNKNPQAFGLLGTKVAELRFQSNTSTTNYIINNKTGPKRMKWYKINNAFHNTLWIMVHFSKELSAYNAKRSDLIAFRLNYGVSKRNRRYSTKTQGKWNLYGWNFWKDLIRYNFN